MPSRRKGYQVIMKIKKNEILFLIALAGVLSAVAVYFWIFQPTREKTEALEAENVTHAEYVRQLEGWAAQVDFFQEETVRMIVDVNDIFIHFPPASESEDAVMYAVGLENQDANTYISAIGINQPETVYIASPTTVKLNNEDEASERVYSLRRQQITYTQQFTYDGMKRYVGTIVNDSNRRSIETLNMAYDNTTGILVGTATMNLFTINGSNKVYQDTVIPSMPTGTDNIFGTIDPVGSSVMEPEEAQETAE